MAGTVGGRKCVYITSENSDFYLWEKKIEIFFETISSIPLRNQSIEALIMLMRDRASPPPIAISPLEASIFETASLLQGLA